MIELPIPSRVAAEAAAYDEYRSALGQLPSAQRDQIVTFVNSVMDDADSRHETLRHLQVRHDDPVAVEATWLTDSIAHIDFRSCGFRTAEQFAAVLKEVLRDSELRGIILDVRWNHGGRAATATAIASHFVPKDTLLARFIPTVAFEADPARYDLITDVEPDASDVPLVLLVNRWSASTSEVLAAGLQAAGRATILGEATFGKPNASLTLANGESLSPGTYARPDGSRYDPDGVQPDVPANDDDAVAVAIARLTNAA